MSKYLAAEARKNSPLTERNLGQNRALGGRTSTSTEPGSGWADIYLDQLGWVGRERERERETIYSLLKTEKGVNKECLECLIDKNDHFVI